MNRWLKTCWRESLVCLLLAAATLLLYAPVRHYDFVNFDDPQNVYAHPVVQSGLNSESVRWALTTTEDYWRPLTRLSHLLDVEWFGLDAGAHHRTNVLLHTANALLLFGLLRYMTGSIGRSAFVTAVFALHPLQVESVAWITERKDVLSTLFWMLTLWAYARYARWGMRDAAGRASCPQRAASKEKARAAAGTPKKICPAGRFPSFMSFLRLPAIALAPAGPLTSGWYWAALLLFAAGLTAKPMLITLPFVLLLLDFWPLRRMAQKSEVGGQRSTIVNRHAERGFPEGKQRNKVKWQSAIVNWKLLVEKFPFFALAAGSAAFTLYAQHSAKAIMKLVPLSARICYALTSYVTYIRRIFAPFGLGVMYPGIEKAPPPAETAVAAAILALITAVALWTARRRPYLLTGWLWFTGTLVPVIGILQVGAQSTADRFTYLPLTGILIMAAWGAGDILRPYRWRVAVSTAGAGAVLLACAVLSSRQLPSWKDSFALYEHSLDSAGPTTVAHHNLGSTYLLERRWEEAASHYREAARMDPGYDSAHNGLGVALANLGQLDEAAAHLREAIRITPDYIEAHSNLAQVLEMQNRTGEAIRQYREVLRLAPGAAPPQQRLDRLLARNREMVTQFRAAANQRPDDAFALNNLAWVLATGPDETLRNGGEAVRLAERACDLTANGNPGLLDTLAAAYAEAGRFDEAVKTAERAAELARESGNEAQAQKIKTRLELYRQCQPFRQ